MDPSRANGSAAGPGSTMSRAERFEDEKRRIIESCFEKKDVDGSLLETYITHIRITEYSSSPSAPPPLEAKTPNNEKARVIIVAVRKSGRVRMHKSKENPNGTFSIGKTWNLDDLTAIESYTSPNCDPVKRKLAGETGFTVTLGKPYFWEAQADKEKKFFIASLIKIYGKYTGGRVPELIGFDQRELDQVTGASAGRRQQPPPPREPLPRSDRSDTSPLPTSRSVGPPPSISSTYSPAQTPSLRNETPGRNGASSPAGSVDSARMASQNQAALRRVAGSDKSSESLAPSAASFTARSDDGTAAAGAGAPSLASLPARSRNGVNGLGGLVGRFAADLAEPPAAQRDEKPPPERRRPPMDPTRPREPIDDDLVPAPLMSPGARRDPVAPPPRSNDRSTPLRKDSTSTQRSETSSINKSILGNDSVKNDAVGSLKASSNGAFTPTSTTSTAVNDAANSPSTPPPEPEESRPGLGPMIKKKSKGDIAGAFWKAANAASAFKPRPGGAGDRLRAAANKTSDGPDGITSVVPAPPRPSSTTTEASKTPAPESTPKTAGRDRSSGTQPGVRLSVPGSTGSRPSSSAQPATEATKEASKEASKEADAAAAAEEATRRSIVVGNDVRYLATLGIDPSILDARSTQFAGYLDYFGLVPGEQMRSHTFDDIKADMERELNKAEAGALLARIEVGDERVEAIKKGLDLAISECDELDNLLTLFSVELSTLQDDIAYIEAQGQGLQVQAANQKLLKKELESLLDTCAITERDLEALRIAPLETMSGLEDIEKALVTLYKAMKKIDPNMGGNGNAKTEDDSSSTDAVGFNSDYGKMRIVQEKKEMYTNESSTFIRRFYNFMNSQFENAFRETRRALDGALSRKVDPRNHEVGRDLLWRYSPLVLYARDVDLDSWNRLVQAYQDKSHPLYKAEFRDVMESWKRFARKPMGDEADLLFTAQAERQHEGGGIATTARKLTVKRSQTLAKSLRSPLYDGSKTSLVDKSGGGAGGDTRNLPYEIFAGIMDDLLPIVEMEQNFIIDFFHASSFEQSDFPDVVAATRPRDRRGTVLNRHRPMELDRELARRVTRSMEAIYSFFEQDLRNLIDWVLSNDPLQGVGVLAILERKMADMSQSNQDYLNATLLKLHGNLEARFKKFVDEQIRAIEETKVKIKKRKGVIGFVRVFPNFSTAVENMLAAVGVSDDVTSPTTAGGGVSGIGVRRTVDREYERIIKTMFDSLKIIARENPAIGAAAAAAAAATDPEDKEALNFHILLIENMNYFLEEVDSRPTSSTALRGRDVLEDARAQAAQELDEHLSLYLSAVMRRPLGKLLETLENIEAQLAAGRSPSSVAAQPSNSKQAFNRVLGSYDGREVRKGIETLRRRVEKHFGDADDDAGASGGASGGGSRLSQQGQAQAGGLVQRVLRECEKFYGEVELRIAKINAEVYGGDVLFEWPRAEVKAAFAGSGR